MHFPFTLGATTWRVRDLPTQKPCIYSLYYPIEQTPKEIKNPDVKTCLMCYSTSNTNFRLEPDKSIVGMNVDLYVQM